MSNDYIDYTDPAFAAELSRLGVTGTANYAPYGTELPAPHSLDRLTAPYANLGWLADSGLVETLNEESNSFTPLQAVGPIRSAVSSRELTFQMTLWSIGGLANALYYGIPEEAMDYNEATGTTEWEEGGELPPDFRFVMPIDILEGTKHRRYLLPAASVIERGAITHTKTEMTGYDLTIRANLDNKVGYAIKRTFKEGWKPGTAGTILSTEVPSLGDWSQDINSNADTRTFGFALTGATGGTFDLRIGSVTARGLATDVSGATVQTILRSQGLSEATVTGTDAVAGLTIKKVPAVPSVDASNVTGGTFPKTVTVTG